MIVLWLLSAALLLYPTIIYPLCLALLSRFYAQPSRPAKPAPLPLVSLLLVVRNGAELIAAKLQNSLDLDYPCERLEIILISDGSTDKTVEIARQHADERIKICELAVHSGKIAALNRGVPLARGDILLFTDVSALLNRNALTKLAPWFQDAAVGGVCGRKTLTSCVNRLGEAQLKYSRYEDLVRGGESRISSIASNEGFLYAMRKDLFTPIPDSVTDDLYNAMSVVLQKQRMLYDPEVTATLPVRASRPEHELLRRRRVVCQSLTGIWQMKRLLNPLAYGWYAWILFSHKVARRLVPIFMLTFFLSSLLLFGEHPTFSLLFGMQAAGYAAALAQYRLRLSAVVQNRTAQKLLSAWFYFCLGNLGTLIGVAEFICGKKYAKWEPLQEC